MFVACSSFEPLPKPKLRTLGATYLHSGWLEILIVTITIRLTISTRMNTRLVEQLNVTTHLCSFSCPDRLRLIDPWNALRHTSRQLSIRPRHGQFMNPGRICILAGLLVQYPVDVHSRGSIDFSSAY